MSSSAIHAAVTPYQIALRLMERGVREIPGTGPTKTNWLIAAMNWLSHGAANEDDPWCGSGMHFTHWILGYEVPKNPSSARAWLNAGTERPIAEAQKNDVVILWRESRAGWKGHLGFFHSWSPSRQRVNLLGGNQSDGWTVAPFASERILGVRTPKLIFNPHQYEAGIRVPGAAVREV